jgi:hypothetical protein
MARRRAMARRPQMGLRQSSLPARQRFDLMQRPWKPSTRFDPHKCRRQYHGNILLLASHSRTYDRLDGRLSRSLLRVQRN